MRERRDVYGILVRKHNGNMSFWKVRPDGRLRGRLVFRNMEVDVWSGLIWLRIGTGGCHL